MDGLTDTAGIVATAAAVTAAVALVLAVVLAVRLRRLRAAQRTLLASFPERDLVAHAAGLRQDHAALHAYVEDAMARLHARVETAEGRLEGTLAHRALVRYDAYGEMSGRQSTTVALLDATRSGLVLSSIHHRDSARLYAKELRGGRAETELSPEEDEAVRTAIGPSD